MTEIVPTSLKALMAAANAAVPRVTPVEARAMVAAGALLVDVRDANEVAAAGGIDGAINVSRGMLEFRADPDSPVFDARFDRAKPVVLLCASGGRAALGGKALRDLGYGQVFNAGAAKDW